jgi:predicted acylesterase/phospholipase RssA
MPDKRNKIALCLAGGGITGAMYEVGCLKALDEIFEPPFCSNQFDIVVGTSAGALIASLVVNHYSPEELFEGICNEDSRLNFKRKSIYNLRASELFKALLPLFRRIPKLLGYGWRHRRQVGFMDLLSILQEFLPPGIFSLRNLDKFVAALLYPEGKTNDFRNLTQKLYIPATDLDTGERFVFGEDDDSTPISKAVAASAAIPMFFRPYHINGHDYIDGATSQVAHMDVAIRNGAKIIVVINPIVPVRNDRKTICLPTFDGKCATLKEKGISAINDQSRRIETHTRFNLGFERFRKEHPDIDYIVIEPDRTDSVLFMHGVMEFESRKAILNYGYYATLARLKRDASPLRAILERHGFRLKAQLLKEL